MEPFLLLDLPSEIVIYILKFFGARDLCIFARASKVAKMLADSEEIWKYWTHTQFPLYLQKAVAAEVNSFKQLFLDTSASWRWDRKVSGRGITFTNSDRVVSHSDPYSWGTVMGEPILRQSPDTKVYYEICVENNDASKSLNIVFGISEYEPSDALDPSFQLTGPHHFGHRTLSQSYRYQSDGFIGKAGQFNINAPINEERYSTGDRVGFVVKFLKNSKFAVTFYKNRKKQAKEKFQLRNSIRPCLSIGHGVLVSVSPLSTLPIKDPVP